MSFSALSFGQLITYAGAGFIVIGVVGLIAGFIGFSLKRKALKKQLVDKYGF